MISKMFASAVETSFHRGNAGAKGLGDLRMTATFLHQSQEGAILRPELGEGVPQCVELLGIDGAGRLRDVFMLGRKRQKNAAQLLAAEVVDARVARESKEPRFKLLGCLQPVEGADHFDEDELGDVLDCIAAPDDGVNETSHPALIGDDEVALGIGGTALSAAYEVDQLGRRSWFHAVGIAISSIDAGAYLRMRGFDEAPNRLRQHFPKKLICMLSWFLFPASRFQLS